jgi:hemoglobin
VRREPRSDYRGSYRPLVDAFYIKKVRSDRDLGPVFARAIPGDWEPHLATMRKFWSSVMLTSGRNKGNPVAVHQGVQGMELRLFDRWLTLFEATCRELFDEKIAAEFGMKARRIAESLKLAVFYRPDRPWPDTIRAGSTETPPARQTCSKTTTAFSDASVGPTR